MNSESNMSSHDIKSMKKQEKEQSNEERRRSIRKQATRKKAIIAISIFAVILLGVFAFNYFNKSNSQKIGQYDAFAKCLTEKGATMYGTDWCSHCQDQKKMFGSSFQYIVFVNCDKSRLACETAGVEGYPTWAFEDKTQISGTQSFATLAQKTGCTI